MGNENTTWRKASYSNGSGDCVEVGTATSDVVVRDTANRDGGTLEFSAAAWAKFVGGLG